MHILPLLPSVFHNYNTQFLQKATEMHIILAEKLERETIIRRSGQCIVNAFTLQPLHHIAKQHGVCESHQRHLSVNKLSFVSRSRFLRHYLANEHTKDMIMDITS